MWLPTMVGVRQKRENCTERRMLSGSTSTSSSSSSRKSLRPASTVSSMAREKPPDPPRFGWSTICSWSPSAAATSGKPGWSATFWSPWSTT